jgi:hypothetical protein
MSIGLPRFGRVGCVGSSFFVMTFPDYGPRLYPDASWWLKFERAQKHLQELKDALAPFTARREHAVGKGVEGSKSKREWVYRSHVTGDLDPNWAVILGDVLFNFRSALDHIAVALNPKRRQSKLIYFPISEHDPWARQEGSRKYFQRDPEERRNWRSWTRFMPDEAVAIIKSLQPYQFTGPGQRPQAHVWLHLKRLHNSDKHRKLLIHKAGFESPCDVWYVTPDGERVDGRATFPMSGRSLADGAELLRLPYEVDVHLVGSALVAFGNTTQRLFHSDVFDALMEYTQAALYLLEPFTT